MRLYITYITVFLSTIYSQVDPSQKTWMTFLDSSCSLWGEPGAAYFMASSMLLGRPELSDLLKEPIGLSQGGPWWEQKVGFWL